MEPRYMMEPTSHCDGEWGQQRPEPRGGHGAHAAECQRRRGGVLHAALAICETLPLVIPIRVATSCTVSPCARRAETVRAWITACDRGVQYCPIRYGQALADCRAVASVGSTDDSYAGAMAQARGSRH